MIPSMVWRPLGTMFASKARTDAPSAAGIAAAVGGEADTGTRGNIGNL